MHTAFTVREKWDVHTHTTLSPDTFQSLARFTHYADFVRVRAHETRPCCAEMVNGRGEVQRVIEHNAYDAGARIAECNAHGVTMQLLSPTPMMIPDYVDNARDAAEICRILNDDNAALAVKFPTRFMALGALPMQDAPAAIREAERIRALGMRGVEINSNIAGEDLSEEKFFPIFEALAAMGMAVFIHPWGGLMSPADTKLKERISRNWRPWLLMMGTETALAFDAMRSGRVHERLPKLRVLYAHGGGAFPALLGRLEHGAYCRPDLFAQASPLDVYRTVRECGVYCDTLTHNPWALKMLIDMLGAERLAMGSDYPYPLGELDMIGHKNIYPGHMIEHLPQSQEEMQEAWEHFGWLPQGADLPCVSDAQKARLLSGTAKEWLGVA